MYAHERKDMVTSKSFSETVRICYAYALRMNSLPVFGDTMSHLDNLIPHTSILTSSAGESSANEQASHHE
ncbi:hypothetical protein TNCV_4882551 [Trichonephila clavipes]|nr:hypothetical protein TNCV_4882551 [Trichonephila clavipes]